MLMDDSWWFCVWATCDICSQLPAAAAARGAHYINFAAIFNQYSARLCMRVVILQKCFGFDIENIPNIKVSQS